MVFAVAVGVGTSVPTPDPNPIFRMTFKDAETTGVRDVIGNVHFVDYGTVEERPNVPSVFQGGDSNSIYFDGNTYFHSPLYPIPPVNCAYDPEQCIGSGFTVSFWARPNVFVNEEDTIQWLMHLWGKGNPEFGLKIGNVRSKIKFYLYGRQDERNVTCKIDPEVWPKKDSVTGETTWLFVVLKTRKFDKAPLYSILNGYTHYEDTQVARSEYECRESSRIRQTPISLPDDRQTPTPTQLILGGALNDQGEIVGKYQGDLYDFRFYDQLLSHRQAGQIFRGEM